MNIVSFSYGNTNWVSLSIWFITHRWYNSLHFYFLCGVHMLYDMHHGVHGNFRVIVYQPEINMQNVDKNNINLRLLPIYIWCNYMMGYSSANNFWSYYVLNVLRTYKWPYKWHNQLYQFSAEMTILSNWEYFELYIIYFWQSIQQWLVLILTF